MLVGRPGTRFTDEQLLRLLTHALPPSARANSGEPWKITPMSTVMLKWWSPRGSRLPKPTPSVGATLLRVSAAVPLIGLAGLLIYVTPPSVKVLPLPTEAV